MHLYPNSFIRVFLTILGIVMSTTHASLIKSRLYNSEECTTLLLNMSASDELSIPIIKSLSLGNADMNALSDEGESAMHYAVRNNKYRHLKALRECSSDIHTLNTCGLKPIHYAGMVNDVRYVDFFVDHGIDINDMGDSTKTPLMFASFAGDADIVTHIVGLGADTSVQDLDVHSWSCLHIAIAGENPIAVKSLLQLEADPNITSDDKITPLHWACMKEDNKSIQWLLEYGADKYAYTIIGETAWDLASPGVRKRFPHLKA